MTLFLISLFVMTITCDVIMQLCFKYATTHHGIALVHCIGRMDGPGTTSAWLRKYIFPGGYAPALSEVLPVIEKLGLWVMDIEILRLHYVKTLKDGWDARFQANRAQIAKLYDERFCRMWEFYLIEMLP